MAAKEEDTLDSLISRICKDLLEKPSFKRRCEKFLTTVDVPEGWQDTPYQLHEKDPTYKFRYNLLKNFIEQKEGEGYRLTGATSEDFFTVLNSSCKDESFLESHKWESSPCDLDSAENLKLQGVVVLLVKSDKLKKASVLIKREDENEELVLDLKDDADSEVGFPLKVGDIVRVTKWKRIEFGERRLELEILKCFFLSDDEILSFLNYLLLDCGSITEALTEITRCHAAWDFLLQLPKERCDDEKTQKILDITDKICSSTQTQMSQTVRGILEPFERSVFFTRVLPDFVNKINNSETFSLVQRFLERVLEVCPRCGPRVLSMAKNLVQSIPTSSQDYKHTTVDFFAKLSSIIALKVPGACEDVDALQWRELPLIPAAQEIFDDKLRTDHLPVIKKDEKYESEDDYLNTYFRLLRAECFHKLKKGINGFVSSRERSTSFDPRDMMFYRISLEGVTICQGTSPSVLSVKLKYSAELQQKFDLESTHWLMFGNLLCISFDGTFEQPVWALVKGHIVDERVVWVTLCRVKESPITEAQFVMQLQEMTEKNEKAYMAESQTFYLAFGPAMDVLQHRGCVPFKEFLVFPEAGLPMEPASYISKIKSPPDWEIIFEKESLPDSGHKDKSSPYMLLQDFEAKKFSSQAKLDSSQCAAVELALKNKLALIQGPPGTGKSFVGVALVNLLLSMNVPQEYGPILIVTYKNRALDHFLQECCSKVPASVKMVRVGRLSPDASEELKKCLLQEVDWPKLLYKRKTSLSQKLWEMQPQVAQAYSRLRRSNLFDADMFIKGASEDQTRYLLIGMEAERVDAAEVERLLNKQKQSISTHSDLEELVRKALKDWLPSQEDLDSFAKQENFIKERRQAPLANVNNDPKSKATSPSGNCEKQRGRTRKEDQEQENPNDCREPSSEQRERLLAVEKQDDDTESECQSPISPSVKAWERKLIHVSDEGVKRYRSYLYHNNLWELAEDEKVKLVYALHREYYKKASDEFLNLTKEYMQIHQQLQELKNQHNIEVMRKCHVIGMTVTGATIRANLLADIKPSVMIVEEAAEILEGQLVAVIPPSVQHLIMIGDHKQLRPMVHFDRLRRHHNLDVSMFERLVNCGMPFQQLEKQCRMRDEIADLLRQLKIYKVLDTNFKLVGGHLPPECVNESMYFWTHTKWESQPSGSHSKQNVREAEEITVVAERFCDEGGILPSTITVLCSYHGQVKEIEKRFRNSKVAALGEITITTIDSFQGQENDIILVSLVRSSPKGDIGYLKSINRLCVAISRARCGLYLFGNHVQLSRATKGWKVLCEAMWIKSCVGNKFPFSFSEDSKLQRSAVDQPEISSFREGRPTLNFSIKKPLQETRNSEVESASPKDESLPIQETASPVSQQQKKDIVKTFVCKNEVTKEGASWDLKEFASGRITFPPNAVKEPTQISCSLLSPWALSPYLDDNETLVSDVIELSHDGANSSELDEAVTVSLSHSATELKGYEVVFKQLIDAENNKWTDLKTTNHWRASDNHGICHTRTVLPSSSSAFAEAKVRRFSSYAVISRLKSFPFLSPSILLTPEFTCTVSEYPGVRVAVPSSVVQHFKGDFSLTIKVEEVPRDSFRDKGVLAGPVLHILCSQDVGFQKPVTVTLPVSLRTDEEDLPDLSCSRVRIFTIICRGKSKEWTEITEKLESPADLTDGVVTFQIKHFSVFWVWLDFWKQPFRSLLQYAACLYRRPVQEAAFLACLCKTDSPEVFKLTLCCYPVHVKPRAPSVVYRQGEGNSLKPLCNGDKTFVSILEALEPVEDTVMEDFSLKFLGDECSQRSLLVHVGDDSIPQVAFIKRQEDKYRSEEVCRLSINPIHQNLSPASQQGSQNYCFKDGQPTDKEIGFLANDIVEVWKKLAFALGLSKSEIYIIDYDEKGVFDKAVAVLCKWTYKFSSKATFSTLADGLAEVERIDLLHRYCLEKR